jgi:sulfur-oxidizing protein SoxY
MLVSRLATCTAWGVALAAGGLKTHGSFAAAWNENAFEARTLAEALKAAGIFNPVSTTSIVIRAPEIAENGAQVPIEIATDLPGADTLYIFVDKNPQPFAGSFSFMNGAEPFVSTRIKMGETSNLSIVARARGKFYLAVREVKVTIGGCGT